MTDRESDIFSEVGPVKDQSYLHFSSPSYGILSIWRAEALL